MYIVLGLFIISLLSFSYGLQIINGANETILDHPALSTFNDTVGVQVNDVRESLNTQQNVTEADVDSFTKIAFGDLNFASFFTMINRFVSYPIDIVTAFFNLIAIMIGVDAIVLGILTSLVVFGGIIAWYRTMKRG